MERILAEAKGRMMATFRVFLVGNNQPLEVDIPVAGISELGEQVSCSRFIRGTMTKPDEEGVMSGVLIAASRIQLVVEA